MLEILLVRHGQTDWNKGGRVMGRRPIPLNREGRREAEMLAHSLKDVKIDRAYTSPVMRALQTARLIARSRGLKVETAEEMSEVDYGAWVGKTFQEVSREKAYQAYRASPKSAHPPGGEKTTEVAARALGFIDKLRKKHKKGSVLLVSHADVIRAILLHYLEMDLNRIQRIQIDSASVSVIRLEGPEHRVVAVNFLPSLDRIFNHKATDRIVTPRKSGKAG